MKVFISWSGTRSRVIASALRSFLQDVNQQIEPWMSDSDLRAGERWGARLAEELDATDFGIFCLTRDAQTSRWLAFEAGALSKSVRSGRVCPYLIDLAPNDVEGPLRQFQSKNATRDDTQALLVEINKLMGQDALDDPRLRRYFDNYWPDLEQAIRDSGLVAASTSEYESVRTAPEPDATVLIRAGDTAAPRALTVEVHSPHLSSSLPPTPIDIADVAGFAHRVERELSAHTDNKMIESVINVVSRDIADALPARFWEILQQVGHAANEVRLRSADEEAPSLLLITDDPHVPWELARMPHSLDGSAPPFIGAQFGMSRWPGSTRHKPHGGILNVQGIAFLYGSYEATAGFRPLPLVKKHSEKLALLHKGWAVDASLEAMTEAFQGFVKSDGGRNDVTAIHFEGHGDNDGESAWLAVFDSTFSSRSRLSDFVLGSAAIASKGDAFLFINAARAATPIGDYGGGFALRAIQAGFRGFVAPLLPMTDVGASEFASEFYAASEEGLAVGEIMRRLRCRFPVSDGASSYATWIAYRFCGHPLLRLELH